MDLKGCLERAFTVRQAFTPLRDSFEVSGVPVKCRGAGSKQTDAHFHRKPKVGGDLRREVRRVYCGY